MTLEEFDRARQLMGRRADLTQALDTIKACKMDADVIFGTSYRCVRVGQVAASGILDVVKTLLTAHLEERIADLDKEFEELGSVRNG